MGFLGPNSTFASAIATLIGVMNMLVGVLAALAVVAFFIGLVQFVRAAGAKGLADGRERIVWSLIALFVLFSLWGIINLLSIAFFGTTDVGNAGGTYNFAPQSQNNPYNSTGSLY